MAKHQPTIGDEVIRILRAYKEDLIDEEKATQRIGEKFSMLGQNQTLFMQQESLRIARNGVDLQAEQNVIFKELYRHFTGKEFGKK